jgi:hypothetical protein
VAVCDTEGCLNGECVAPDECVCFSGWGANNCTLDQLTKEAAKMYLDGLMVKVRKLPALVVHKNEEGYRDSWKCVLSAPSPTRPEPTSPNGSPTLSLSQCQRSAALRRRWRWSTRGGRGGRWVDDVRCTRELWLASERLH